MPDKMHLLMVLHSHQPVGNFEQVFAMATEKCYRPVMEILYKYPQFRLGLHFSGPLLLWLERGDPELLDMVKAMQTRGQVELLSGAFYEPLLAAIPRRDAVTQLQMQNRFLAQRFGANAKGFWLAERIWEPGLPEITAQAGLDYTIVDDTHFYYAGLNESDMFGYHLTEREGQTLALFPTNKELRYTIPFQLPEKTIEFLRRTFEQYGPTSATYGDDSEKFGLWPRTYELVIKNGWLEKFIEDVLAEDHWLKPSTPGYVLAAHPPKGRIYVPTASYEEMLMWALPWQVTRQMEELIEQLKEEGRYEKMRRFLRGGLWENFLVKYRESNLMHKKMLFLSQLLENNRLPQAYDYLLQAQCNCSYWHGLFGGLYLSHIRHAVHANLIAAESLLDERDFPSGEFVKSETRDIDLDGHQDVLLSSGRLDCMIHPAYGGSISLLNLREARFNLADTLTRRPEAYHSSLFEQHKLTKAMDNEKGGIFSPHDKIVVKEEGLNDILFYDWYERAVFQDHVLPFASDLPLFIQARHIEWGDFVDKPYELLHSRATANEATCAMRRGGHVWSPCGPWPLSVEKTFSLDRSGRLGCAYSLKSSARQMPPFRWAVELNLTLLSDLDSKRYIMTERKVAFSEQYVSTRTLDSFSLVNDADNFRADFNISQPATLWSWPVYTVSQSESGLERTYQGTSLVLLWDMPGGVFDKQLLINLTV